MKAKITSRQPHSMDRRPCRGNFIVKFLRETPQHFPLASTLLGPKVNVALTDYSVLPRLPQQLVLATALIMFAKRLIGCYLIGSSLDVEEALEHLLSVMAKGNNCSDAFKHELLKAFLWMFFFWASYVLSERPNRLFNCPKCCLCKKLTSWPIITQKINILS